MIQAARWWETASAVVRVSPKHTGRTLREITADLDRLACLGFDVVEVFAPASGGTAYEGLDSLDFTAVDPAIGTLEDFIALVDAAHDHGMAVVAFLNLGYTNEEHPAFLQACDDVRRGVDSSVAHWFRWSETGEDALGHPDAPFFQGDLDGEWTWSERAGRYYWVKWRGEDGDRRLPQLDFAHPGWQAEARRILEFWAATGIDGLVVDAVNWYIGADWSVIRSCVVDLPSLQGRLLHPEGAGGFGDDPVAWVERGGFDCIMDYGLNLWWEGIDVVGDAVATGNPSGIEPTLRAYRDRVVAAGGMCYVMPGPMDGRSSKEHLLRIVTIALVGELILDHTGWFTDLPAAEGTTLTSVLQARRRYPVLGAVGDRELVATDDPQVYAFLRRWGRDATQVLVALNFGSSGRTVHLRHRDLDGGTMTDALTGAAVDRADGVSLQLSARGFAIIAITPDDVIAPSGAAPRGPSGRRPSR